MNENLIIVPRTARLLTVGALKAVLVTIPDEAVITVSYDTDDAGMVEAALTTRVVVEPRRVRRSAPRAPIGFQWLEGAELVVTLETVTP